MLKKGVMYDKNLVNQFMKGIGFEPELFRYLVAINDSVNYITFSNKHIRFNPKEKSPLDVLELAFNSISFPTTINNIDCKYNCPAN